VRPGSPLCDSLFGEFDEAEEEFSPLISGSLRCVLFVRQPSVYPLKVLRFEHNLDAVILLVLEGFVSSGRVR
jgi:hypothetical protein